MKTIRIAPNEIDLNEIHSVVQNAYSEQSIRRQQTESFDLEHLERFYVCYSDNKIVGRMALYTNPKIHYQNKKTALIGNYECMNDSRVSQSLFEKLWQDLYLDGFSCVIGPINGSTWYDYRFKTDTENPPFFSEPEQQPFYNEDFLNQGFIVLGDYQSYLITDLEKKDEKVNRRIDHFLDNGLIFKSIDKLHLDSELKRLYEFSMQAFAGNFLFTPISCESFVQKYKSIERIISPEFSIFAEDKNGKLVGFVFGYPDLYNLEERRLVGKTVAISPLRDYAGIGVVLERMITDRALENDYHSMIHAFIKSGTYSSNISKNQGTLYRTYRLYVKHI